VALKSEVDTWLRFMADTVESLFGQVLVVSACFGKADGFLPNIRALIRQHRWLLEKMYQVIGRRPMKLFPILFEKESTGDNSLERFIDRRRQRDSPRRACDRAKVQEQGEESRTKKRPIIEQSSVN
jgi:hypothetical protein